MTLAEILVSLFLLAGTAVMLLASISLHRFGDVYLRMHGAMKSSGWGISLVIIGVALYFGDPLIAIKLLALSFIYFFTAATGAQVLASASHAIRAPMVKETWIDELAEHEAANAGGEALPPGQESPGD